MSDQPIRVPCPMCQTVLKGPAAAAGKKVKCKKCGHSFTAGVTAEQLRIWREVMSQIPGQPTTLDPNTADALLAQPDKLVHPSAPSVTYVCDHCGRYGQAPLHNAGLIFTCECGGEIRVPEAVPSQTANHQRPPARRAATPGAASPRGTAWLVIALCAGLLVVGAILAFHIGGNRIPSVFKARAASRLEEYLGSWQRGAPVPNGFDTEDPERTVDHFVVTRYEIGHGDVLPGGTARFQVRLHFLTRGGFERQLVQHYDVSYVHPGVWHFRALERHIDF